MKILSHNGLASVITAVFLFLMVPAAGARAEAPAPNDAALHAEPVMYAGLACGITPCAGAEAYPIPYVGPSVAGSLTKEGGGGGGLSLSLGYRHDTLFWNIDGGPGGVNILSELTWKDIRSVELGSMYRAWSEWGLYLRGSIALGLIYHGTNQDSDYNGDNRTLEYSRSNNASDSGSVFDASGAVGYAIRPVPWLVAAPVVGYSYHEQNLDIKDGYQTIPATGSFANLDSSYDASWYGDWVGVDVIIDNGPVAFAGTAEYHWANYFAEANWNLITTFAHPVSFEHTAEGYGLVYTAALDVELTKRLAVGLTGGYSFWRAKNGTDRTFLAAGGYTEQGLNEVEWESYSVGLACTYLF